MSNIGEESSRVYGGEGQNFNASGDFSFLPSADGTLVEWFEKSLKEDKLGSPKPREEKKKKDQDRLEDSLPCFFDVQREAIQSLQGERLGDSPSVSQNLEAIVTQVVAAIQVLEGQQLTGQMLRMSLQNVGLLDGVSIDMHLNKEGLSVAFFAEEALAYDFLKKNLPHLQKTLEAQGLKAVRKFQIACYREKKEEHSADLPRISQNRGEKGQSFAL